MLMKRIENKTENAGELANKKEVQQTKAHIRFIVQPVVYDASTAMSLQIALDTACSPNERIY